ncbi:hypothetical protein POM88_006924 [Heracleum sosnowskyi]|uniref:Uncharacterized protein n=1 Tax=Heracleum sosnowskyi TaxID=360622 RepID=A0AAD8J6F5_9APIA|nr:hypothetical protein POM88_006924 [Heracleum sosnowskyi]
MEQFMSCLWKQLVQYLRSPNYNLVLYFYAMAIAVIVETIVGKVCTKKDSSTCLSGITGAMYHNSWDVLPAIPYALSQYCDVVNTIKVLGWLLIQPSSGILRIIMNLNQITLAGGCSFGLFHRFFLGVLPA